jgi:hypothetical protein
MKFDVEMLYFVHCPDHHEDILTFNIFLYMGPFFYGEFADFTILYLYSNDNMY